MNPVSGSEVTESIQGTLNVRFDYVLPCGILSANIVSSQVFRTDLLANPPFPLLPNDDRTASDHLPVQMIFANPYNKPFRLTLVEQADKVLTLGWEANAGQSYRIEGSTDLSTWTILADNVAATGPSSTMAISMDFPSNFFRVRRLP